ncbi:MAG: glycosyltransferase [Candidatus Omnitrophota bacterium]
MRIGIMAAWNTTSGVAMHAEPIGKALKKKGHQVTVLTFKKEDHHGEGITAKDEKYVIRCFGTRNHTNTLDPRPFLENKFDILLIEDLGMLPAEKLNNMMTILKKKTKIVHIVHENRICEHSWFYQIDWDKIVYFDNRQDFLKDVYPDAEYIPFPCFPVREGDKIAARKRLKLPLNKKIIYSFEHRGYHSYYTELPPKLRKDTILLHMLKKDDQMLEEMTSSEWRIIRKKDVLSTKEFDDYLFASDAVILHKFQSRFHAVVSSTVFQALGAGCPIFVPQESDFFHTWDKEVIHYRDISSLNRKLVNLLKNDTKKKSLKKAAEKFVKKNSPGLVTDRFIDIFQKLLDGGK